MSANGGAGQVGEIRARITLEMADFRRQMAEARQRIQDLERDSRRGADGMRDFGSALAGIGAGAALNKLVGEMRQAVDAATKLYNAYQGLNAVSKGVGEQTANVQKAVADLASRGFVSLTEAALAYKTALSTGIGLEESTKLINSLADSAAYNRQSFYTMSGAIQSSLDGIKNGNSVLADAVGVTQNLSVMQKIYAESIGTTVGKLTDQQKIQAAVNGFMREGAAFVGNADQAMQSLTGSQNRFTQATNSAAVAFGQAFTPLFQTVLETLTPTIIALADFVTENKALVSAAAASSVGVLGLVTILATVPPALKLIAAGLKAVELSAGPVGWAILAIGAVGAGIGYLTTANAEATAATKALAQAQTDLNAVLNKAPIDRTVADVEELKSATEELTPVLEERARLQQRLNELNAAQDNGTWMPEMFAETMDVNDAIGELDEKLEKLGYTGVEQATAKLSEMNAFVKAGSIAITDQEKAEAAALATKKQTLKEMSAYAAEFKKLNSAQELDATQKGRLVDITEKLIEQYPELNASQGEDGRIRATNIDAIISQIDTDKRFTDQAAANVSTRIRNFGKESAAQAESIQTQIDNLTRLSNALAVASGAKASSFAADTEARAEQNRRRTSGLVGDIVTNGIITQAADNGAKAEIDAQRDEALKQQQKYADAAREMEKLAAEVETGKQTFEKDIIAPDDKKAAAGKTAKTGKTLAEIAAEARKTQYQAELAAIQYQSEFYNLTADKQIEKYEALKKKHSTYLKESVEDARTLNLQLKRLGEDSVQSRYDFSATTIDNELRRMEDAGASERELANQRLYLWNKVRDRYSKDSAQYRAADEQAYQARKDLLQATADEEAALYKSRKELADKAADIVDDLVKAEKDAIKDAKDADLDAIDERKRKYLDAQNEKIAAIDELMAKEQQQYSDVDYATQLSEKNARIDELASAVGPAGIAEREQAIQERDRMVLEHDRDLRNRELEAQKTALEKERDTQEAAFDAERSRTEAQYDTLLDSFETYSNDVKTIEASVQAFRVTESANANSTILADLDAFLIQYKAKAAALSSAQQAAATLEYNMNKDAWTAAKASGNTAQMQLLTDRNQEIRDTYGITGDTGKLSSLVQGAVSAAQLTVPYSVAYSAPRVAAQAPSAAPQITNHIDMSMNDVEIADPSAAKAIYSERERLAARIQASGLRV